MNNAKPKAKLDHYIAAWASILANTLLTVFYLCNPDYLKEPVEIRERVKQRAKQQIREELISYSKKLLD